MGSVEPVVELVVQADDFGMCHAVNEGVTRAFTDGIVTQASTMAPCPGIDEATRLARTLSIPVGLHQTLTCEWDHLRWSPITHGPSLIEVDGTFHRTVAAARQHLDVDEAIEELHAQARRVVNAGLRLSYLDVHMGMVSPPAYLAVSEQLGIPFLYPGLPTSLPFDSIAMLSARDQDAKKPWLLMHFDRLQRGRHLLVTHPAVPGSEMSSITGPDSPPWRWAEEYRASDLDVLTDPEVSAAIAERSIKLVSLQDVT